MNNINNTKVNDVLDQIKDQNPSRQRYYFMFLGIVVGIVGTLVTQLFI